MSQISHVFFRNFKSLWIAFSIFLLAVSLYLNWFANLQSSAEQNARIARKISSKLSVFMEDLFQDAYTLPVYRNERNNCGSLLLHQLERITMNNPFMSGLILSDNRNQFVCSNLPDTGGFPHLMITEQGRSLRGPFISSDFEQKVYVIQQRIAHYSIGIVLISSVLKHVLETNSPLTQTLVLYSQLENKDLIRLERSANLTWDYSSNPIPSEALEADWLVPAIEKISALNDVVLVAYQDPQIVKANLLYSECTLALLITSLLILLYFALHNFISKHYSLRSAMKLALKNKQFYPVYQPIYDSKAGCYSGAEVLLRWQGEKDEVILPDFFIQEAESTGLIVPITLEIIALALKQAQPIWEKHPKFYLAFNLSALHFLNSSFFNELEILLEYHEVSPQQILLEITERDLLDSRNALFINQMRELRSQGFSLAIDDYGTGHSNISYLQNFPFTHLKIDKIFVQAIGTQAITESLNKTIIQMAKGLGLIIVAEGVETEAHMHYLLQNGVQFLQGWYYSKAVSMKQLRHMRFIGD